MSLMCPARPLAQFLETIEVVIDVNLVKESSSAVATVKGGFRVDPPCLGRRRGRRHAGGGHRVHVLLEARRRAEETSDVPPNDCGAAPSSATSCASAVLPDGKRRTYAKVDAAQA